VQLLGVGTEVSTANNVAATPITVPALATTPDLAITSLVYGNSSGYGTALPLAAGSLFTPYALYQNLGQPLASHSELGFYLSADATLSADDHLLGKTPVESTAPDRSTSVSLTVRMPTGTAPGTYYLLGVADVLDQMIEADEQNNVYAIPLSVELPTVDFSLARLSTLMPTQTGAGGSLTVNATVQNTGSMPLDSASLGYYLSSDRLLSADDILLGHDANTFRSLARTLTLPPTLPLGNYYLLLVADYRQEVAETDETNNVAALPFAVVTPNLDLTVTTPASSGSYEPVPGNTFYVRCSLANLGNTIAYPATLGYYLSADQVLSPDDALLTQKQLLPLAGGASQSLDSDIQLPPTVTPGNYYLLLVADYRQELAETNETNNVTALSLKVVQPNSDLAIERTFTVLPTRAPAGTSVSVKFYFYNEGTTPVYAPAVGFYLSADNVWSPDDAYVGSYQYSRYYLYPRNGITPTGPIIIPRTAVPGRYYLLGVTDPLGQYTDPNPANNVGYAVLDVTAPQPDLQPLDDPYISAKQVVAGGTLTTECYLNNLGAADAGASRLGYYLSTDPFLSANDVLIGSTAVGTVLLGNSRIVPGTFTVPPTTAGRRYYVLFVADYLNQLPDLVRANNVAYTILAVTAAPLAAREQLAGAELLVAPVPVASPVPLRVQLSGLAQRTEATLGLYNSLGQLVAARSLTLLPGRSNQAELPTAGLAAGIYIMRLTGLNLNATRRVVIE
jgi:subtilase family serine protease